MSTVRVYSHLSVAVCTAGVVPCFFRREQHISSSARVASAPASFHPSTHSIRFNSIQAVRSSSIRPLSTPKPRTYPPIRAWRRRRLPPRLSLILHPPSSITHLP
ncbi:hypothetical protein BDN70DRAFT_877184 [Pholiota conissans]|uniref:Uncharacterized protein n=1 Tax=Pholiota conissans TaxID=109636 RepID=A0A9P5Z4Y4_9AGAR|nr:hypothetical protein BDN70DRAFT_877184 [Pholiota conissans]